MYNMEIISNAVETNTKIMVGSVDGEPQSESSDSFLLYGCANAK